MSKLNLRVNYKNACILKHALRNQIRTKEMMIKYQPEVADQTFMQELEEEKRALEVVAAQIDKYKSWEKTVNKLVAEGDITIIKDSSTFCHCCKSEDVTTEILGFKLCDKCIDDFNKARQIIDKLR